MLFIVQENREDSQEDSVPVEAGGYFCSTVAKESLSHFEFILTPTVLPLDYFDIIQMSHKISVFL